MLSRETPRKRGAKLTVSLTLALLVALLGVASYSTGLAHAIPECDVPEPPPVCTGEEPTDPGPQPDLVVDKTVTVPENEWEVDTGVVIKKGDKYQIDASGEIWAGVFLTFNNGPEGWTNFDSDPKFPLNQSFLNNTFCNNKRCSRPYSLIGTFNFSSDYFYVGRTHLDNDYQGATEGDRLFLRTNDDTIGNGSGNFTARIRVWRMPGTGGGDPVPGPPVIFVPAFSGTEIECDLPPSGSSTQTVELWPPHISTVWELGTPFKVPTRPRFENMLLQLDGVTNFVLDYWRFLFYSQNGMPNYGNAGRCDARIGEAIRTTTTPFGSDDVYGRTIDYLRALVGTDRTYVYPYDWRKGPGNHIDGLDQLVDKARRETGEEKVVIVAHSMGGLVSRWYIDDPARAQKVSRLLTLGTPYWGSPKAWVALAHGNEGPDLLNGLDMAVNNVELRMFSRNSSGLYSIFPGEDYNAWPGDHNGWTHGWLARRTFLNTEPRPLNVEGTLTAVETLNSPGGNRALAEQAIEDHSNHLDGFKTNGVDYRVLTGSGLETMVSVEEPAESIFFWDTPSYEYDNGDETVPLFSQLQGEPGGDMKGEDVPVTYACKVKHIDLVDPVVLRRAGDFLKSGGPIPMGSPCGAKGAQTVVNHGKDAEVRVFKGESNSAQAQEGGQASLMLVEEAEFQGLVDVIEHGEQRTVLVTDDDKPVKISVSGEDVASEVTRLQDDEEETPVAFAPVDGEVVVTPGEQPSAVHEGQQLTGDSPDDQPPVTTVSVRYSEDSVFLSAQAQDDSGVRATYYRIGEEEPKAWEGEIEVPAVQLESLRYASIDVFGNAEVEHEDIYNFSGFFSPVDNPDVLNQVKAGSAIPVKFGLSGDQSLDIFAKAADGSSYPRSAAMTCDSTDPTDAIEQTVTAGQSGLSYDATTDRYTYVWKTSKEWRGCRQLVMKLNDGSFHRANFKFTK